MKKIKVGVVGIGHLGNYHLQKYQKLPNSEIVGVADIVKEHALSAAEKYNCNALFDHRDLIGKVDAVSVAVPTVSHYKIAKDFLESGVDVLLEKPITATLKEADELVAISDEKGTILQIGFIERFNPAIVALKTITCNPLFIESHRLHPFGSRGTDVDVILDLMIHDLDIILHFVKSDVLDVEAVGVPVLSDKVDLANVRITFRNRCVANITASRISNKEMQKIRFFGVDGYHSVDCRKRELISLGRRDGSGDRIEIVRNSVEVKKRDPLEEEIISFLNSVTKRTSPLVSGKDGRETLKLALHIIEKMKTGQEMIS